MICPFCNIPSAHIGPFRLGILYQCLSLHAGDSSFFSSKTIRIKLRSFLQTSLQLVLVPMVPWAEVWSNWGVRQTRFMATITFFPVPYPASQAQSSSKKPPSWKVKCGEKVLQCCNFLIWLFHLASGITSVCQSKVCAPTWNGNNNFNVCVTNSLTFLSHTYTNTQDHDKAECEIKNTKCFIDWRSVLAFKKEPSESSWF